MEERFGWINHKPRSWSKCFHILYCQLARRLYGARNITPTAPDSASTLYVFSYSARRDCAAALAAMVFSSGIHPPHVKAGVLGEAPVCHCIAKGVAAIAHAEADF